MTVADLTSPTVAAPARVAPAQVAPAQVVAAPVAVILRTDDGRILPFEPPRWFRDASRFEEALLSGLDGPVLDVGCGPGRLVVSLGRLGTPALGVDPAAGAVALARRRGAPVLQRSVFDTLPGDGRWRSVLLFDGNIGIGGDPRRLLRRCHDLMAPAGEVLVEVEPPGAGYATHRARLEQAGHHGPWFRWAVVGADAIEAVAGAADLSVTAIEPAPVEDRWFARLVSPVERSRAVA